MELLDYLFIGGIAVNAVILIIGLLWLYRIFVRWLRE
jgi:hypothetical protein